jgi:hypothetical protein
MLPEQIRVLSESGAPRYAVFVLIRLKEGDPIRAWTGPGDLYLPPDDVDEAGGIYQGIGLVGEVPALRQLIGGTAERIEFSLSGVDEKTVSLADEEADEVIGAPLHVGVVFFDEDWQSTPICWAWDGTADMPSVDQDGSGGQVVRQVKLSVASAYTDRTRPFLAFLTDADQRRRSPTDAFCCRVAGYSIDSTIKWPG